MIWGVAGMMKGNDLRVCMDGGIPFFMADDLIKAVF